MRPRATRPGLASIAGFAALYLLFARTGIGRDVDQAALIDQLSSVEVDQVKLFDVGPVVAAIAVLGAIAWVRLGLLLAVAIAASIGVSSALALALTKVLPQVVAADPSFPSGDATLGMAIACAIVLASAPAHRRLIVAAAAAVAIVVGIGLVALEWHRPAEVAAGYLLAVACACPVLALPGFEPSRPDVRRHPVEALAAALAALFLLFLTVRALVFAIDHGELGDWLAFAAGELLLAALATALLTALHGALDQAAARP
jgi:hypothetical protein